MHSAHFRFRPLAVGALLFVGTVLLFSRAIPFGFINYDDPAYVTANPHVQGGLSWPGLVWAFTAPADYWHPLTWLSHMLDWQLYGASAAGHHLTSVLWHAANAVLVFLVFRRLGGGLWWSAFLAAVFAWHPLRVESVVWVTERKDVMSGCFFLLTLLAYARHVSGRAAGESGSRSYLMTLACFALGLMCKPMLVTLPLVLLMLDFWPFGRFAAWPDVRAAIIEKLPFFALSSIASVLTLLMQRHEGAFVLTLPVGARAGNALVSLTRYAGKFLWPVDLIVCYPHPGYWPAAAVAGATVLLLALGWLAWRQRRSRPWLATGGAWFVVTLLPVLGLVQVGFQAMADRYTYVATLGLELALFWNLRSAMTSSRRSVPAAVLGCGVLGALAARTWDQQLVWRDSVSLFAHAVAASPDNANAEDFLASALVAENRFTEAAAHAERACELNPRSDTARITLASIRQRQGRTAEAIALYRAALSLRPHNPAVQMELGSLELRRGRVSEARSLMSAALHAAPALRDRTRQIGLDALRHRDLVSARYYLELVLETAPDDVEANIGFGYLLLVTGERSSGLARWCHALELAPEYPGLREQIARESGLP